MPQLLKPVHLEPVLRNKRSHHNEKPTHCNEEYPLLTATRESPRAATKIQHSQKKKKGGKINRGFAGFTGMRHRALSIVPGLW